MTSGTSGCDKHSIVQNEMEAAGFAFNNVDSLKLEIAEGHGEYLNNFAQTLRCDAEGQSKLAGALQSHYSEVVDDVGIDFYKKVRHHIRQSEELSSHCLI